MTTPNPNDPTNGQFNRPPDAPIYIDPITHQQLYMDPVTGQLHYDPVGGGEPQSGVAPVGSAPPQSPYRQPYPQGYPYAGYGYGYPYAPPRSTNGLAVASLITSVVGLATFLCYGLGIFAGVVGAILGHVARRQIRSTGQEGAGLALAGIIVGWIGAAMGVLGALLLVAVWS
jgi:Domain of unknown function (DUF4190)